jgi:hypothetical protein
MSLIIKINYHILLLLIMRISFNFEAHLKCMIFEMVNTNLQVLNYTSYMLIQQSFTQRIFLQAL